MGLLLTLRTVRYLRPVQVMDRARRTIFPWKPRREAPAIRLVRRAPSRPAWERSGVFDGKSVFLLNRRLGFEGEERWNPPGAERLWVYNLHYLQFLFSLSSTGALSLMKDWVASNSEGPGWEPYPLSLRIREWIEWLQAHPEIPEADEQVLVDSLGRQAQALEEQLEYHLLGNHLLENALTLVWAGVSLEGPAPRRWLDRGREILIQELSSQCLVDGTHEERSPMYQALIAEALLRLAEVAASGRADVAGLARGAGERMVRGLAHLVHPDGRYAELNDSTQGVAPSFEALCSRFPLERRLPVGDFQLGAAGYYGSRGEEGDYVLFDAGPLGPDHQPGHGHADMLSFVLDRRGRPLFTDTSVGTYTEGAARLWDRGTAAHNTVEVDGLNQSELWGAFRCGRRARILEAHAPPTVSAWSASCHGPGSRNGSVRHDRRVVADRTGFVVSDDVTSPGEHEARVRLHVAPGLWIREEAGEWRLGEGSGPPLARVSGAAFHLESSVYHPGFGQDMDRPCLVAEARFHDRVRIDFAIRFE